MKAIKSILVILILLSGFITLSPTETNAGPRLRYYSNTVKLKSGYVWVEGQYKINKHGKRVWIPGHWKKI